MKILEKIIISVAVVIALIGSALIEGSLSSYAKANGSGIGLVASENAAESGGCAAMPDKPLQNDDCRHKKIDSPDNNSLMKGRSKLNYPGSFYRTDKDEAPNQGLIEVDWPKNIASVVLNSQGDARVLSKVGLEAGPGGDESSHHEQAESDGVAEKGISGSLLVSILALIAIVAVARRNVSERTD